MATILTTTGISLWQNTAREHHTKTPTEEQMRHFLRLDPARASAEANSLLKIATSSDEIVLLHTDTHEARVCAVLLQQFLINEGYKCVVVELQLAEDEHHLETRGLRNLVNSLIHQVEDAQRRHREVIINATAGFKAEVVYSTMIGMLYQVPVKYIYEKFQRIVTFNPVPLDWDTSLILSYRTFFDWIDSDICQAHDVEKRLAGIPDEARIRALLTLPDEDNHVFLSPVGEAMYRRFQREQQEAEETPDPPPADVSNAEEKIGNSLLRAKHHPPKGLLAFCRQVAHLPPVQLIVGGNYENTTFSRIKGFTEEGSIRLLWADNEKAQNVIIQTTAQGRAQTRKIVDQIQAILEKGS